MEGASRRRRSPGPTPGQQRARAANNVKLHARLIREQNIREAAEANAAALAASRAPLPSPKANTNLSAFLKQQNNTRERYEALVVERQEKNRKAAEALAAEAAQLMEHRRITSLLVVDQNQHLCGALNSNDLMRAKVI